MKEGKERGRPSNFALPGAGPISLAPYGARCLSLPPYSLDFKLIEPAFSKLNTWLRTAQARTRGLGSTQP